MSLAREMTENVSQNVGLITKSGEKSRILTASFCFSRLKLCPSHTDTCGAQEERIFFQKAFSTGSSNMHLAFQRVVIYI